MLRFVFLGLAVTLGLSGALVASSAVATPPVRTTDAVWFSDTDRPNSPRLGNLEIPVGESRDVFVWLEVQTGAGYDVGGFTLPIEIQGPAAGLLVGAPGPGVAPESTVAPAYPTDSQLQLLAPFDAWDVRSVFDATGDAQALLSSLQQGVAGSGWNGTAPVARLRLNAVAAGSYTVDVGELPLAGGGALGLAVTSGGGAQTWAPLVEALRVTAIDVVVGVPEATRFALRGGLPSPASHRSRIAFELGTSARVDLSLYDVRGQRVRSLVDGENLGSGAHERWIDVSDMPVGVYFARMVAYANDGAQRHEFTRKLVVVRE